MRYFFDFLYKPVGGGGVGRGGTRLLHNSWDFDCKIREGIRNLKLILHISDKGSRRLSVSVMRIVAN